MAFEGSLNWKVFFIMIRHIVIAKSLQSELVFIKHIDVLSQEFQGKFMVVNTKNLSMYQSKY